MEMKVSGKYFKAVDAGFFLPSSSGIDIPLLYPRYLHPFPFFINLSLTAITPTYSPPTAQPHQPQSTCNLFTFPQDHQRLRDEPLSDIVDR
jgi:hypothetical protein